MGKESKLFDKRFVHFMWDDELKGKVCIVAANMKDLIFGVENDGKCAVKTNALRYSGNNARPFNVFVLGENCSFSFAYYDPNYEVKKAYNKGKPIQATPKGTDKWLDLHCKPTWDVNLEYRVKPKEESYRPYESSAEMIVDFIDRFKVNRPPYGEPLIWVKTKSKDVRYLITGFGKKVSVDGVSYSLDELFKYYAYLDGSPCGKEC